MRDVYLIGIDMTPFGIHQELSVGDLARQAVSGALTDAGVGPEEIGSVMFANAAQGALEGQHSLRAQHALRPLGIHTAPMVNLEDACSGSSVAFNLAVNQVASGVTDIALAVGAEKLTTDDKDKKLAIFAQPLDLAGVQAFVRDYMPTVEDIQPPAGIEIDPRMRSIFMDSYSILARMHMKRYGTTWEQIAMVSEKNHYHSTMNPLAQFQKAIPLDEILKARVISWPLTLPMCAPVSDGAAAAVLATREVAERVGMDRAVKVLACTARGGTPRDIADSKNAAMHQAALKAYDQAGITPQDISVAEVHDASAYAEINLIEMIGLCGFGEGGRLTESGATRLGGKVPVNTSGGLQSKGHPISATGIGQLYELATQLRGEAGARQVAGARYAISANGGGFYGVEDVIACVTILGK